MPSDVAYDRRVLSFLGGHLGELAGLGAAFCWVFTSLAFAAAGRRIGPTAVNITRIFLALLVLLVINRVLFGHFIPDIRPESLALLAISGVIGLALGDQLLFTALVDVGPRISTLLMTLAPPVAALLAWPALHEALGPVQIAGISVTTGGIAWVVLERPAGTRPPRYRPQHRVRGVMLGGLAGVCQAVGLILSKLGMGHVPNAGWERVDPWIATMYRMMFAAVGISIAVGVMRWRANRRTVDRAMDISAETAHLPPSGRAEDQRRIPVALLMVCLGTAFGPVLGVWCSMVAVDRAAAGIAATLMAMTPVFVLPFAVWIEREHVSWRAVGGAMVAVGGVAILTGSEWIATHLLGSVS
jgi:drug/metabolite transporter (DMT)-like permease